jgi:modulator of FtsH protease HflK
VRRGDLTKIAFLVAGAGWGLASTYVVRPSELGVVLRFGAPRATLLQPGLHFCPRGIDRVIRVEATRVFTLDVGGPERTTDLPAEGDFWLTGDTNVLGVHLVAQYQISDPARYLLRAGNAPEILRRALEAATTESLAVTGVDDILTRGRAVFLDGVRTRAQALVDGYGAGVHVVSLALRSAEPPESVIGAFKDVQDARSDREKVINQAKGYANETLPKARGDAETLTAGAAAERDRRAQTARGDAERFEAVRAAAARAPDLFRQRVYLETLERLLPRLRLYVVETKAGGTRLRLLLPAPQRAGSSTGEKP